MAEYEDYEKFLWEAGRRAGYPLVRVSPPNMDTLLSAQPEGTAHQRRHQARRRPPTAEGSSDGPGNLGSRG